MFYDEINNKEVSRCKRKNVSLPLNPDDEALNANGFSRIAEGDMPEYDPSYQTIVSTLSEPVYGIRTRTYTIEDLPLEDVKKQKLAELSTKKNTAKSSGFLVDGVLWDSDEAAWIVYNSLTIAFYTNPSYTVENFKVSEGNWITMTSDIFSKAYAKGNEELQAIFTKYKEKTAAVANALTSEEVAKITW